VFVRMRSNVFYPGAMLEAWGDLLELVQYWATVFSCLGLADALHTQTEPSVAMRSKSTRQAAMPKRAIFC
jgi:hypothetical protein